MFIYFVHCIEFIYYLLISTWTINYYQCAFTNKLNVVKIIPQMHKNNKYREGWSTLLYTEGIGVSPRPNVNLLYPLFFNSFSFWSTLKNLTTVIPIHLSKIKSLQSLTERNWTDAYTFLLNMIFLLFYM